MKKAVVWQKCVRNSEEFREVEDVKYAEGMCHIFWNLINDETDPVTVVTSIPIADLIRVDVYEV